MLRRSFLKFISAAAGVAVVAPELLLPQDFDPHRTFFLPPDGGWRTVNFPDFDFKWPEPNLKEYGQSINVTDFIQPASKYSIADEVKALYDADFYLQGQSMIYFDQFADLKAPLPTSRGVFNFPLWEDLTATYDEYIIRNA